MNEEKKKNFSAVSAIISITIMIIIFMFSAQEGNISSSSSEDVSELLAKTFNSELETMTEETQREFLDEFNGVIRKLAHFAIYAALGFFVSMTFEGIISSLRKKIMISFIISVIYAAIDEIHQYFIPGRSGKVTDVLLDSAGVIFGITSALILIFLISRLKKRTEYLPPAAQEDFIENSI